MEKQSLHSSPISPGALSAWKAPSHLCGLGRANDFTELYNLHGSFRGVICVSSHHKHRVGNMAPFSRLGADVWVREVKGYVSSPSSDQQQDTGFRD